MIEEVMLEDGSILRGPRDMRISPVTEEDMRAVKILKFNEYVENEIGDDLRISILSDGWNKYYTIKSLGKELRFKDEVDEYNFRYKIDTYSIPKLYDYIIAEYGE